MSFEFIRNFSLESVYVTCSAQSAGKFVLGLGKCVDYAFFLALYSTLQNFTTKQQVLSSKVNSNNMAVIKCVCHFINNGIFSYAQKAKLILLIACFWPQAIQSVQLLIGKSYSLILQLRGQAVMCDCFSSLTARFSQSRLHCTLEIVKGHYLKSACNPHQHIA